MEIVKNGTCMCKKQNSRDITTHPFLNFIKCKICNVVFPKEEKFRFIMHLYKSHKISELTEHPEREFLLQKFNINEKNSEAKCRTCQKVIVYNEYGLYLLKNHVEIYHGKSSHIYHSIVLTENGCHTLERYFINGIKATCLKCEKKIDMTHSETLTAERVKELLDHYFSHRFIPEQVCQEFTKNVVKELNKKILSSRAFTMISSETKSTKRRRYSS